MKRNYYIFLLIFMSCILQADDRPQIDTLLNKTILISDSFSGQSITLIKESNKYYVIRIFFGSGLPIINTLKYSVTFDSDYQIRFSKIIEGERKNNLDYDHEEFILQIINNTEIRLYLNNIQVVTNQV